MPIPPAGGNGLSGSNNDIWVPNNLMRQRVIRDAVGDEDWSDSAAYASMEPDLEANFREALPRLALRLQDAGNEFGDIVAMATILATLTSLPGGRPGVAVNQRRLRYWTYSPRLHSLGEDPASVLRAMITDEAEEEQEDAAPELIDLSDETDDEEQHLHEE